ncbi:MAG: hypothetical protein ACRC7S_14560 [Cetobacterium sp.]
MNRFEQCTTKEMCKSAAQLLDMMVVGCCSVEELFKMEDKMEDVRVIRKLEYLDGLENGMGAIAVYDEVNKRVRIRTKEECLGIGIARSDEYSDLDGFLTVMKVIGFKFEYKPLRTIDQVKAEMLLKCKEFKFNSKNYFINYVQQDKRYYVSYDCFNNILGALYFDKETANEYCNELNEILKKQITSKLG